MDSQKKNTGGEKYSTLSPPQNIYYHDHNYWNVLCSTIIMNTVIVSCYMLHQMIYYYYSGQKKHKK